MIPSKAYYLCCSGTFPGGPDGSIGQTQHQNGTVEITSATVVPEELLLEHDWWIRNEWKVEDARV
eukprot:3129034-Amphidinium_carterae.1